MKNNLSSKINLSYIDNQYYHPEDNYELAKVTRMEKIDTELFIEEKLGSIMIANEISKLIHFKQQKGEICVLGLTNGKSMMTIYSELIRQHKEESLDFQNVHIVLLYEFYPLTSKNLGCFAQLNELFFKHINIPFENLHSPYDIDSKQ
jgi:glucosamine-6-phosphate deaminase